MSKKAIVVISLVEEGDKKANEEIKREIHEKLSRGFPIIPWCKEVVKVKVIRERWKERIDSQTDSQRTNRNAN